MHRPELLSFRRSIVLLYSAALAISSVHAQQVKRAALPAKLPYSFSNLVWWDEPELRSILKNRIPGLQDEIAPDFAVESKIREVLLRLLKQKGIDGNVVVSDPPFYALTGELDPDAPPIAIEFKLVSPDVWVRKVSIANAPDDLAQALANYVGGREGKPYFTGEDWIIRSTGKTEAARHGYLDCDIQVGHDGVRQEGDHYSMRLVLNVHAGPQYHISAISADGGPLLTGRDLSNFYQAHPGDIATLDILGRLAGQIRGLYTHNGYSDVNVDVAPVLDHPHAMAAYNLTVTPGPQYRLRRIAVRNLDPAQESEARKLLALNPGEIFDETAVSQLYGRIRQTPLLQGYSFSFGSKKDAATDTIDLTLSFFKAGN